MALKTMPLSQFLDARGRKPTINTNPNRHFSHHIAGRDLTSLVLIAGGQVELGYITPPEIKPMPYSFDYACWQLNQHITEQYYLMQALRD